MSCISAHDTQLARLADAIAQRVGQQRFHVWFNNSTRLDLRHDGLEIAVPNDFISEWIGTHFTRPIQEAAHEVLGCSLHVRFAVVPQLFEVEPVTEAEPAAAGNDEMRARVRIAPSHTTAHSVAHSATSMIATQPISRPTAPARDLSELTSSSSAQSAQRVRLRHVLDTLVVGRSNQLAFNAASHVAEFPGTQYNPLFIHGACGLGKTHLLQGICRKFVQHHPTRRWTYITGEEFTNEYVVALRTNKVDSFRRKMRELDLLVIDDVHFLSGKKATQEEFLHTFNAIEAMGRQVVMASDSHPKMIEEFGESLVNRFVSGMVVRVESPNLEMRAEILRNMCRRGLKEGAKPLLLDEQVINWIAQRVTQNVRELEGAITRISAYVKLTGRPANMALAQEVLGDLDRQMVTPIKPETILQTVSTYFGIDHSDLMSGHRQRTVSLARSIAMYLVRRLAKLSYPEIGGRMGKRNHSTVISACRRIERAIKRNERLVWASAVGERSEQACDLTQRLEELCRATR